MPVMVNGATETIVAEHTEIEFTCVITATGLTAITTIATTIAFTPRTVTASTVRTAFGARLEIKSW